MTLARSADDAPTPMLMKSPSKSRFGPTGAVITFFSLAFLGFLVYAAPEAILLSGIGDVGGLYVADSPEALFIIWSLQLSWVGLIVGPVLWAAGSIINAIRGT